MKVIISTRLVLNIFLFITFFIFEFGIASKIPLIHLCAFVLTIVVLFYLLVDFTFDFYILYFSFLLYISWYLLNTTVIQNVYDFSYIYGLFLRYFVYILSAYNICNIYYRFNGIHSAKFRYIAVKWVLVAAIIQSLAIILMVISPTFNNIVDKIIPMGNIHNAGNINGARFRGFSNVATAALSVSLAIGNLCNLEILRLQYNRGRVGLKRRITSAFFSHLIFLGIFFSGRTGLFSFFLIYALFLIKYYKFVLNMVVPWFILFMFYAFIIYILQDVINFEKYLINFNYAFEFILNNGQSDSTNVLTQRMLFLPDNIKTWIIGDAQWSIAGTSFNYKLTDSGWVRAIFVDGIVGLVLFYGSNILFFRNVYRKLESSYKFFFINIFVIYAIFNVKEGAFYGGMGITFILFFFCFVFSKE